MHWTEAGETLLLLMRPGIIIDFPAQAVKRVMRDVGRRGARAELRLEMPRQEVRRLRRAVTQATRRCAAIAITLHAVQHHHDFFAGTCVCGERREMDKKMGKMSESTSEARVV